MTSHCNLKMAIQYIKVVSGSTSGASNPAAGMDSTSMKSQCTLVGSSETSAGHMSSLTPTSHQESLIDNGDRAIWTHEAVLLLVNLRTQLSSLFTDSSLTMKQAWRTVAEKMRKCGHNYSGSDCDRKFRNLKLRYKMNKKNIKKTCKGSRTWRYFQVMDDLMQGEAVAVEAEVAVDDHDNKPEEPVDLVCGQNKRRLTSSSQPVQAPSKPPPGKKAKTSVPSSVLSQLREDVLRMHTERMELERRKVDALERLVGILEKK